MDALSIVQATIGLAFALFIPGYLIVRLAFDELEILEQMALAIGLSILVDITVGIFLGYNETMKNITGGLTAFNVWSYLLILSSGLGIALIMKYRGKGNKKIHKA